MITVKVSKTEIQIDGSFEPVTSGAVNAFPCAFEFGPDWDNMVKTATFRAGKRAVSAVVPEDGIVNIPWEVIEYDGLDLYVGVTGMAGQETPEKTDDIVLPTVWALIGTVRNGAAICGTGNLPTPGVYEQLTVEIADLKKTKQDKLSGAGGQIVGFDEDGNPIAIDMPESGTVSIAVESTTTLPAGSEATVENVGTEKEARLAFGIPAGADGVAGANGRDALVCKIVLNTDVELLPNVAHTFPEHYYSNTAFTRNAQRGDRFIAVCNGTGDVVGRSWIAQCFVQQVYASMGGETVATVRSLSAIETTGLPGADGEPGQDGIDALTYGALIQHYPEPDMVMEIPSKYFNRAATEGEIFSGVFSEDGKSAIGILSVKTYTPPAAGADDAMSSVEVLEYAETNGLDGMTPLAMTDYLMWGNPRQEPAYGHTVTIPKSYMTRAPEPGDTVVATMIGSLSQPTLKGRTWIVLVAPGTELISGTSSYSGTLKGVVETTAAAGPAGPAGPAALVYEGTAIYSTEPTDIDMPVSLFNRTPAEDDYVSFIARGEGDVEGRSWLCSGLVASVDDTQAHVIVASVVETTGAKGRGINNVNVETETGPAGGEASVAVQKTVDPTTSDLDLLFHFNVPGSYFPPAEPKLEATVIDLQVGSNTVKALRFAMTRDEYYALIAAPPPALFLFYITLSTNYTHPDGQMMITPVKLGTNSNLTAFWVSPMMYGSGYVNCGNGSLGNGLWGFQLNYVVDGVAQDFPDYELTSIKYMLGW